MSYVIYNKSTSAIVEVTRYRPYKVTSSYKTMAAAKAALTRMSKQYWKESVAKDSYNIQKDPQFVYGIAEIEYYYANIEKQVERVNMMTGKKYMESVNTPRYCSPSSEAYWSM
jgi:hypothetical protein